MVYHSYSIAKLRYQCIPGNLFTRNLWAIRDKIQAGAFIGHAIKGRSIFGSLLAHGKGRREIPINFFVLNSSACLGVVDADCDNLVSVNRSGDPETDVVDSNCFTGWDATGNLRCAVSFFDVVEHDFLWVDLG